MTRDSVIFLTASKIQTALRGNEINSLNCEIFLLTRDFVLVAENINVRFAVSREVIVLLFIYVILTRRTPYAYVENL